jgi:hypothetical protein
MKSLSEAREFLEIAIVDVMHDISSDWIEKEDCRKMQMQLQLLITAKGCLDAIAKSGEASQIFKSSIKF